MKAVLVRVHIGRIDLDFLSDKRSEKEPDQVADPSPVPALPLNSINSMGAQSCRTMAARTPCDGVPGVQIEARLARIASQRAPVLANNMSTGKKTGSRIGAGNKPMQENILLSEILALHICAKSETFAVKKVCGFLSGDFHKKMFKEY